MDEIARLLAKLRGLYPQNAGTPRQPVWFPGPQPESAIHELEQAFEARMPPSYRSFLARFGALWLPGPLISGILDGRITGERKGWAWSDTVYYRREWNLPANLLVVEHYLDTPTCLDTSQLDKDAEYPVVRYSVSSGQRTPMADSFEAWFLSWLVWFAEEDEEAANKALQPTGPPFRVSGSRSVTRPGG
jgi:hypothetical protein